jgi:hypothetical protein
MRHEINPRQPVEGELLLPGMWLLLDQPGQGNLSDSQVVFVHELDRDKRGAVVAKTTDYKALPGITAADVRLVLADPPTPDFRSGDRVQRRNDLDEGTFVVRDVYQYQPGGYTFRLDYEDGRSYGGVGGIYLELAPTATVDA